MSKTTGKLKYDLALSSTTLYDASSIYVNKSAELSLNGNANLTYKTIGPTYTGNGEVYFGPPTFGEYHILELNAHKLYKFMNTFSEHFISASHAGCQFNLSEVYMFYRKQFPLIH